MKKGCGIKCSYKGQAKILTTVLLVLVVVVIVAVVYNVVNPLISKQSGKVLSEYEKIQLMNSLTVDDWSYNEDDEILSVSVSRDSSAGCFSVIGYTINTDEEACYVEAPGSLGPLGSDVFSFDISVCSGYPQFISVEPIIEDCEAGDMIISLTVDDFGHQTNGGVSLMTVWVTRDGSEGCFSMIRFTISNFEKSCVIEAPGSLEKFESGVFEFEFSDTDCHGMIVESVSAEPIDVRECGGESCVELTGEELVVNGGFDDYLSDWDVGAGWSWENGEAKIIAQGYPNYYENGVPSPLSIPSGYLSQDIGVKAGRTYNITLTARYTLGNQVMGGIGNNLVGIGQPEGVPRSFIIEAENDGDLLRFYDAGGQIGAFEYLDDISVKEVGCGLVANCVDCGEMLGFYCERDECEGIAQGCYFIEDFGANTCESCVNVTCEDYDDNEQTCNGDACNLGCSWDNGICNGSMKIERTITNNCDGTYEVSLDTSKHSLGNQEVVIIAEKLPDGANVVEDSWSHNISFGFGSLDNVLVWLFSDSAPSNMGNEYIADTIPLEVSYQIIGRTGEIKGKLGLDLADEDREIVGDEILGGSC